MGEVVNLNRARKAKAKVEATTQADANRVAFGRSKAEKDMAAKDAERRERTLDKAKRDK